MLRWPPCPRCVLRFDSSWHITRDKLKQPWETRLLESDLQSYWELRQGAELWNSSGALQLLTFSCTDQQGVFLIQDWSDRCSEGKWEARESHATLVRLCLPTDVRLPALPEIILSGKDDRKRKGEKKTGKEFQAVFVADKQNLAFTFSLTEVICDRRQETDWGDTTEIVRTVRTA